MVYIPIPKQHTQKLTKSEAIEELSRLIGSKQDDITIIMRTAEIIDPIIDLAEDLRFDYIAMLFHGSVGAPKLRAANVKRAAKGMRRAIKDLEQGNPYHLQCQYIAHYLNPEMPHVNKKLASEKRSSGYGNFQDIAAEGNKWFKDLPEQKSFKMDGKDIAFHRTAVSVKTDLLDSRNKVIDNFGETTPRQRLQTYGS